MADQKPKRPQQGGHPRKRTHALAREFCRILAETANVRQAIRELGLKVTFVYDWRNTDEKFRKMWEEADLAATSYLEEEARRRATEGVDKPIYGPTYDETTSADGVTVIRKGYGLVGTERQYSDQLLTVLLKAHNPARFRENVSIQHGGALDVNKMTDEQLDERIAQLGKAARAADPDGGESPPGGQT